MEDDITFLDGTVHLNRIKELIDLDAEENSDVMDNFILSIDETIMAVKTAAIAQYLADKDIKLMRMGWKKVPEKIDINDKEDLYRALTLHVPIVEEE
jgi:hypothetical protein